MSLSYGYDLSRALDCHAGYSLQNWSSPPFGFTFERNKLHVAFRASICARPCSSATWEDLWFSNPIFLYFLDLDAIRLFCEWLGKMTIRFLVILVASTIISVIHALTTPPTLSLIQSSPGNLTFALTPQNTTVGNVTGNSHLSWPALPFRIWTSAPNDFIEVTRYWPHSDKASSTKKVLDAIDAIQQSRFPIGTGRDNEPVRYVHAVSGWVAFNLYATNGPVTLFDGYEVCGAIWRVVDFWGPATLVGNYFKGGLNRGTWTVVLSDS